MSKRNRGGRPRVDRSDEYRFNARLPGPLVRAIKEEARVLGLSLSAMVLRVLNERFGHSIRDRHRKERRDERE